MRKIVFIVLMIMMAEFLICRFVYSEKTTSYDYVNNLKTIIEYNVCKNFDGVLKYNTLIHTRGYIETTEGAPLLIMTPYEEIEEWSETQIDPAVTYQKLPVEYVRGSLASWYLLAKNENITGG